MGTLATNWGRWVPSPNCLTHTGTKYWMVMMDPLFAHFSLPHTLAVGRGEEEMEWQHLTRVIGGVLLSCPVHLPWSLMGATKGGGTKEAHWPAASSFCEYGTAPRIRWYAKGVGKVLWNGHPNMSQWCLHSRAWPDHRYPYLKISPNGTYSHVRLTGCVVQAAKCIFPSYYHTLVR